MGNAASESLSDEPAAKRPRALPSFLQGSRIREDTLAAEGGVDGIIVTGGSSTVGEFLAFRPLGLIDRVNNWHIYLILYIDVVVCSMYYPFPCTTVTLTLFLNEGADLGDVKIETKKPPDSDTGTGTNNIDDEEDLWED